MGIRTGLAQAASAVSTGVLKHVFHRPAANFPGKMALYIDPDVVGHMAGKLARGSIIVVGTNGKTTTTNLLADALELSGQRVVCNRTGANLDSGVATALLHAKPSDWGVFESDELWMVKVLPRLKSDYVLLLNLFRDQLDRVGEIDKVQASIVDALRKSPRTVLLYNADDPLCTAIADAAPNKSIAFGLAESLGLAQNTVTDAQMCQRCSGMLDYAFRQYGQLGAFHCDSCDFGRHELDYAAADVRLGASDLAFTVRAGAAEGQVSAPFGGAYMAYNLLACYVAAIQLGIPPQNLQAAIDAFNPENGRLQKMRIGGRDVLLNLAKNPIGFNQNLKLVSGAAGGPQQGRVAAAFFLNDKEADGHDISWIWDVDFEELAAIPGLVCFAGGIRKNDLQMRLKYAGVAAELVDSAEDVVVACAGLPDGYGLYVIANYTALPGVRDGLMKLADDSCAVGQPEVATVTGAATAEGASDTPRSAAHDSAAQNHSCAPLLHALDENNNSVQRVSDAPSAVAAGDPDLAAGGAAASLGDKGASGAASDDGAGDASGSLCSAVLPNGGPADAAASRDTRLTAAGPGSRTRVRHARPVDARPGTAETLADVGADPISSPVETGGEDSAIACSAGPLRIVHLFPELLNLYGDGGNPRVLLQRCLWRGIPAQVVAVRHGEDVDLSRADIVFLGGGPDREQRLASEQLLAMRDDLAAYVEADGVLLAICGGYQILGHEWVLGDGVMEGLHILDLTTKRVEGADRIIDNIVLDSPLATHPVVGFENHAGRTFISRGMRPFGKVTNAEGHGNNDTDQADGVLHRNVVGTYLHGPLLGKNPEVADWLIARALERKLGHPVELPPLDDSVELAANGYIAARLK